MSTVIGVDVDGVRIVAARRLVVGGDNVVGPGWVALAGSHVVDGGPGAPPRAPDHTAALVVPGFVDLHCHGGGGAAFDADPRTDPEAPAAAAAFHAAHGTTTMLASLVALPPERLARTVAALRALVTRGVVAGIHLEGPWLSVARCGAQDPDQLRDVDPAELAPLLDGGGVSMVTLAPERPGALAAIARVVEAGAVAAIGHTDADAALTRRALDAGASVGTHLFNGMPPMGHREPGPAAVLLTDPRATVELITDGVHVDPLMWELVARAAPGRVAAITDAISAAGMPDGAYRLGDLPVRVEAGVARLRDGGAVAGSTVTADGLFRAIVAATPQDEALTRAVAWTSTTPAQVLGRDDIGHLRPGARADLVLLDDDLAVEAVLRGGAVVPRVAPIPPSDRDQPSMPRIWSISACWVSTISWASARASAFVPSRSSVCAICVAPSWWAIIICSHIRSNAGPPAASS